MFDSLLFLRDADGPVWCGITIQWFSEESINWRGTLPYYLYLYFLVVAKMRRKWGEVATLRAPLLTSQVEVLTLPSGSMYELVIHRVKSYLYLPTCTYEYSGNGKLAENGALHLWLRFDDTPTKVFLTCESVILPCITRRSPDAIVTATLQSYGVECGQASSQTTLIGRPLVPVQQRGCTCL